MACTIKINGKEKTQAEIDAILAFVGGDRAFVNSLIYDNYTRFGTSLEPELTVDSQKALMTAFKIPTLKELHERLAEEVIRREKVGISSATGGRRSITLTGISDNIAKLKDKFKGLFSNLGVFRHFGVVGKRINESRIVNKDGTISAWMLRASRLTQVLNNVIAKVEDSLTPEDYIALSNVLRGASIDIVPLAKIQGNPAKLADVKKKLEAAIKPLRDNIDEGSELLAKFKGLLNPIQINVIKNNQGKYVTTLYEVHRNPDWYKNFEKGKTGTIEDKHYEDIFNAVVPKIEKYFKYERLELIKKLNKKKKSLATHKAKGLTTPEQQTIEKKVELKIRDLENRIKRIDNALADPDMLHVEVVDLLKRMYTSDNLTNALTAGGQRGAIGKSIFKERSEIPSEVKELFGIIKDPRLAYMSTISKIISAYAAAEYQSNMAAENERLVKKYEADKAAGKTDLMPPLFSLTPLPDVGVTNLVTLPDSFSILAEELEGNQVYVTDEMREFLQDSEFMVKASGLIKLMTTLNTMAKVNATIGSFATQERNFIANLGKLFTTIIVDKSGGAVLKQFAKSAKERSSQELSRIVGIRKGTIKSYSNEFERLQFVMASQGIKGSDVTVTDLNNEFKRTDALFNTIDAMASKNGLTELASNLLKGAKDVGFRFYLAGDDIVKEAIFYGELEKHAQAFYDKSYDDLVKTGTPEEIQEVENEAGVKTRATTFNYTESWDLTKWFQKTYLNLIIGPFMPFKLEMFRTTLDTIKTWQKEIRYRNPANPKREAAVRSMGRRRRLAFLSLIGLSSNLLINGITNLFDFGADDEEEDYAKKYGIVPDFAESPVITKTEEGYLSVIDASAVNLYGAHGAMDLAMWDMFSAIEDGDLDMAAKHLGTLVKSIVGPIFSPQIGTGTAVKTVLGLDAYGNELFGGADDWGYRLQEGVKILLKDIAVPATFKSFDRLKTKANRLANREEVLSVTKSELFKESDPKKIEKLEARVGILEKEIKQMEEAVRKEGQAIFPGIREYIFDPESQLPSKIYEIADRVTNYSFAYKKRVKDKNTTRKERDDIYKEMEDKYRDDIKLLRNYYRDSKKLGWDVEKILTYGPTKTEGSNQEENKSVFTKKQSEYIFGKKMLIPELEIEGYDFGKKLK